MFALTLNQVDTALKNFGPLVALTIIGVVGMVCIAMAEIAGVKDVSSIVFFAGTVVGPVALILYHELRIAPQIQHIDTCTDRTREAAEQTTRALSLHNQAVPHLLDQQTDEIVQQMTRVVNGGPAAIKALTDYTHKNVHDLRDSQQTIVNKVAGIEEKLKDAPG